MAPNPHHEEVTPKQILEQSISEHQQALDKAMAELKKLDEPKLRHGDYGPICNSCEGDNGKLGMMILDRNNNLRLVGRDTMAAARTRVSISEVWGNQLDDLKAMAENVTEFKLNNHYRKALHGSLKHNTIWISHADGDHIIVDEDILSDLILNLRQMQATLARKQKK